MEPNKVQERAKLVLSDIVHRTTAEGPQCVVAGRMNSTLCGRTTAAARLSARHVLINVFPGTQGRMWDWSGDLPVRTHMCAACAEVWNAMLKNHVHG